MTNNRQEPLEEAAERISKTHPVYESVQDDFHRGLIEGAKWQQEQIKQFLYEEICERRPYSASRMCEEVIKFIEQMSSDKQIIVDWGNDKRLD